MGGGRHAENTPLISPPHTPQNTNFREPVQQLTQKQVEQMQLRYYNSDMHRAAFVLPEFARKVRSWWGRPDRGTQGSLRGSLGPHVTQHPPHETSCPTRP